MNGVCGAASCNAGFAFSWTAGKCTNILTDAANWYVSHRRAFRSVALTLRRRLSQRLGRKRLCHLFRPHPGMLGWILHCYLVPVWLHSRRRNLLQDDQRSHRHGQLVGSRSCSRALEIKGSSVSPFLQRRDRKQVFQQLLERSRLGLLPRSLPATRLQPRLRLRLLDQAVPKHLLGYRQLVSSVLPHIARCGADLEPFSPRSGAVGTACAFPHGSGSCVSGICVLTDCNSGYYNILGTCMGYNLQTDENNCGAVGAKCSFNNGYGICSAGVCTFTQCLTGFSLSGNKCNAVDTRSDVNNCGSVGNKCQSSYLNGGIGQCISGLCYASCSGGYTWDPTFLFCVRFRPPRRCLVALG